jgi:hypothetical protein
MNERVNASNYPQTIQNQALRKRANNERHEDATTHTYDQ